MSFIKKNPNEKAYHEGKKHFVDVIKNTGSSDMLIWRQPEEDFNNNSTLIVMPGEKAVFVNEGVIEQIFESGTYKLSTKNYPFISRLKNMLTGGISIFNCVVYFIKTSQSMEILWGTDSPIQVRDKLIGIATKLRCRGSYKVQISDPAKFMEDLIGSKKLELLQDDLKAYFSSEFQSKIKSVIARALNESEAELLGIDARLDEFSDSIQPYMQEILGEYGLRCVKFTVSAIDINDDELRRRYDEIGIDAIQERKMAYAKAAGKKDTMDILGDNWDKQQSVEILHTIAENQSSDGVSGMAMNIGMGLSAGNAFGNMANQTFKAVYDNQSQKESADQGEDEFEKLSKLKKMLDAGLINQDEYDAKKTEILSKM